ncbi:MAG: DUF2238 domain-containing protein [Chthoniobacterales bacterium]|nr:DUF2238 domain-containing protein [Chthoniobacterales bacterium]
MNSRISPLHLLLLAPRRSSSLVRHGVPAIVSPVVRNHSRHRRRRSAGTFRRGLCPGADRARAFHPSRGDPLTRLDVAIGLFVCLGISAFYELMEWWTPLASGSAAMEFIATPGDIWDTRKTCTWL